MSFPEFPKRKIRNIVLRVANGELKVTSNNVTLVATGNLTNTLAEEVKLIKKEINRLDNRIESLRVELIGELKNESEKTSEIVLKQQNEISDFKSKLKMSLVGGGEIKEEALGVLCIIYSLIIPFVSKFLI